MNSYKSFGEFALAQAKNLTEISQATVVRESAIIVAGEMKTRIETRGQNADGGQMVTKSPLKFGAYSKSYGKYVREKKGRQTAHIDLNLTGDTWNQWRVVPTENGWAGTFVTDEAAQIAIYNSENFGPIFIPTKQEIKLGDSVMLARIQKILKRR